MGSDGGNQLHITPPEPIAVPDGAGGRMSLPAGVFPPGATVPCRVEVTRLAAKARSGRIELGYTNTYRYRTRSTGADDRTRTRTATTRAWIPVAEAPLPVGATGTTSVHLDIPRSAPPSVTDMVDWQVRATIDRRHGFDSHAELPLVVTTVRGMYDDWQLAAPTADEQVPITFELDGSRHLHRGTTLTGRLSGYPRKVVSTRGIRLQLTLVQDEARGYEDHETGAVLHLSGPFTTHPGQPFHLPFSLPLSPQLHPTCTAARNSWHWRLDAVVDIAFRFDRVSSLPITLT